MAGSGTTTNPDAGATQSCSDGTTADGTTQQCPAHTKSVTRLRWDTEETWCSEPATLTGDTRNYSDGEQLAVAVKDKDDGSSVKDLNVSVSGNSFSYPWDVLDVLPTGGPSAFVLHRRVNAEAGGKTTPRSLKIRFIPSFTTRAYDGDQDYATFSASAANYEVTFGGNLDYVEGHGKEVVDLGSSAPAGNAGSVDWYGTPHWFYKKLPDGTKQYWNGTAWTNFPDGCRPAGGSYHGIGWYKDGTTWKCELNSSWSWPDALADWTAAERTATESRMAEWHTNIVDTWTGKFDIKRRECRSTVRDCCRYKTKCEMQFHKVTTRAAKVIIVGPGYFRSKSSVWSADDAVDNLAAHEYGHLLANPDEYTPNNVTPPADLVGDGLSADGIDPDCLMGQNMTVLKKRHLRPVCETMEKAVKDQYGKDYHYIVLGTSEASPNAGAGAPAGSGGGGSGGVIAGAIIGAVIGAVAGAIIGYVASGGNPGAAVAGAAIGAVAGALIGAGIGSLF